MSSRNAITLQLEQHFNKIRSNLSNKKLYNMHQHANLLNMKGSCDGVIGSTHIHRYRWIKCTRVHWTAKEFYKLLTDHFYHPTGRLQQSGSIYFSVISWHFKVLDVVFTEKCHVFLKAALGYIGCFVYTETIERQLKWELIGLTFLFPYW